MNQKIDLGFCILLVLGAVGHLFGTFKFFDFGSAIFVWSLSGALAAFSISFLNLVRRWYPSDKRISIAAAFGNLSWILIVILFGQTLGSFTDPRVLFHGLAAAGLLFFSARTALQSKSR